MVTLADKGTLFLDEIGEMSIALQAKLLHFLENGQYRTIDSTRAVHADVRVVAATNRDLVAEVVAGRFREDLYYRINVICLKIPALRNRSEDVLHLAELFATFKRTQADAAHKIGLIKTAAQKGPKADPWAYLKDVLTRLCFIADWHMRPRSSSMIFIGRGQGKPYRSRAIPP